MNTLFTVFFHLNLENICAMPKDIGICKMFLDEPLALASSNALSWKGSAVSTKYCIDYLKYVKQNINSPYMHINYEQCLEYCGMYTSLTLICLYYE